MSRRRRPEFNCQPLAELTRQLLFAPEVRRIEQVRRAEQLHDEIEPDVNYPLDFIAYRITRYQREASDAVVLVGSAILPDLRLMIDQLSRSIGMAHNNEEPMETIRQLADRLRVSTKTIERYRQFGLRWRWIRPRQGGRLHIAFTRDAVDHFLAHHRSRVKRASHFTQIDRGMRGQLIERARQLAAAGDMSLNQVANRLSRDSKRAVETIRLMLEQHDQRHPEDAIFPNRHRQLTAREKRFIAKALGMGMTVQRLAEHFGRTRSTIYRAARDRRTAELRHREIHFVDAPEFHGEDADEVMLPMPEEHEVHPKYTRDSTARVDDLPPELRPLYGQAGMARDQVRAGLVRYNYLKFLASQLRDDLNRYEPRVKDLNQIERWLEGSRRLRRILVLGQLHHILFVARQHLTDQTDRSLPRLTELLAEGNRVLLEAVEQFDITQRQTFESYATWRLMRHFAALSPERNRAQRRLTEDQMSKMVAAPLAAIGLGSPNQQ